MTPPTVTPNQRDLSQNQAFTSPLGPSPNPLQSPTQVTLRMAILNNIEP